MIGLDRADAQGFRKGLSLFGQLPQPHHLIWNDGPRIAALREDLGRQGLAPLERGKGNNIWLCLGLVQALGRAEVVALHDCDVVSFRPRMLARLVAQLLLPDSGFVFAKAYYPRISAGVMYGRVSRLLVTPLLRALRRCLPASRYLEFLDSFRYPLAGECAMRWSAARRLHLPCDWGMEIGVLTEMFRDHSTRQLCQVDIAGAYDHKHQPFPPETGDEDGGHARSARSRRRLGHQFLQHRRERLACRVGDAGPGPLAERWPSHLRPRHGKIADSLAVSPCAATGAAICVPTTPARPCSSAAGWTGAATTAV